jgi:hypothetical protein
LIEKTVQIIIIIIIMMTIVRILLVKTVKVLKRERERERESAQKEMICTNQINMEIKKHLSVIVMMEARIRKNG